MAIAAFPQTAFANQPADKGKSSAPGQQKKADEPTAAASTSQGGTSPENGDGPTTHDGANGPGGQTCDGDPNNAPGAGGQYENTCATSDQTNSAANGNGGGNATGKPCAGCVGNADDKNPKGQYPNGSDHNNGYECDGNNGIGKGNPAHTGCQTSTECVPSDANNNCEPPCQPTPANNHCDTDCNPSTDANQCKPCPGGKDMLPNGKCTPDKCPDGSNMPAGGCKCPGGGTMPASGKCETCPDGSKMPANGKCATCPDGSNMPASGKCAPCPDGSTMPASGKCECSGGATMPANGVCEVPCAGVCAQQTPSCVASADANRCGGGTTSVLGETLARPAEPAASVLGVSITRAAPAGLARTGFELLPIVRFGLLLALMGLGMLFVARRRRTVDIASRIGE